MGRQPPFVLLVLALSGCVGDAEVPSVLGALPDEEAREHNAPDVTGVCPVGDAPDSWVAELLVEDAYEPLDVTAVEVAVDPCGSAVVAWTGYLQEPTLVVERLRPGGQGDWRRTFVSTGRAELLAIDVDAFGNALLLSGNRLHVLTAAGQSHPHVPEAGYQFLQDDVVAADLPSQEERVHLATLARTERGWLVATGSGSPELWHVRLPSGDVDWTSSTYALDGWAQPAPMLVHEEREVLRAERRRLDSYSLVTVRRYTFERQSVEGLYVAPALEVVFDETDAAFADAPLLVQSAERTILGWTSFWGPDPGSLPPAEGLCRLSRLLDIDDADFEPTLDLCGGLQGLVAHPDGSVLSLWALGSAHDSYGRAVAATLVLLHTDSDGTERARWDLADTLGTVGSERYGAASLALTPDGSGVVVAGKSAERHVVTVARIALE